MHPFYKSWNHIWFMRTSNFQNFFANWPIRRPQSLHRIATMHRQTDQEREKPSRLLRFQQGRRSRVRWWTGLRRRVSNRRVRGGVPLREPSTHWWLSPHRLHRQSLQEILRWKHTPEKETQEQHTATVFPNLFELVWRAKLVGKVGKIAAADGKSILPSVRTPSVRTCLNSKCIASLLLSHFHPQSNTPFIRGCFHRNDCSSIHSKTVHFSHWIVEVSKFCIRFSV